MPNLIKKFIHICPQISINGYCYGFAQSAIGALLANQPAQEFNQRLNTIRYGYKGSKEKQGWLSADVNNSINELGLKEEFEKLTTPEAINESEPDISQIATVAALIRMAENYKVAEVIPYLLASIKKNMSTAEENDSVNEISKEELANQIKLAWKLSEILASRKDLAISDDLRHFITTMLNVETFIVDMALHQTPQAFSYLFPKENKIELQMNDQVVPLIVPLTKTGEEIGFEKIKTFSRIYNEEQLSAYLSTLEKKLQSISCTETIAPLAFNLCITGHSFAIGYDLAAKKWLLYNAIYEEEKSLTREELVQDIMRAKDLYDIHLESPTDFITLQYLCDFRKFILREVTKKSNTEEVTSLDDISGALAFEKFLDAIIKYNAVKQKTSKEGLGICTSIYTKRELKDSMNILVNEWLKDPEFLACNSITKNVDQLAKFPVTDVNSNFDLLRFACQNNDYETVKDILNNRSAVPTIPCIFGQPNSINLNCLDENGCSVLGIAVFGSSEEIVNLLLENGAKPNGVQYLLNPNDFSFDDISPFQDCILKGRASLIDTMVKHGADLNFRIGQLSLLEYADSVQDEVLKERLIANGAKEENNQANNATNNNSNSNTTKNNNTIKNVDKLAANKCHGLFAFRIEETKPQQHQQVKESPKVP